MLTRTVCVQVQTGTCLEVPRTPASQSLAVLLSFSAPPAQESLVNWNKADELAAKGLQALGSGCCGPITTTSLSPVPFPLLYTSLPTLPRTTHFATTSSLAAPFPISQPSDPKPELPVRLSRSIPIDAAIIVACKQSVD